MILNIILYVTATLVTLFFCYSHIKYLRKANALLAAESDYYFVLQKLFWNTMSSEQHKEIAEGRELRQLNEQHKRNVANANKTGRY